MNDNYDLKRFADAQEKTYATALTEIKRGCKQSHWMWFIFPQIAGLGFSETTRFYAIKSGREADMYIKNPILGSRLIEICQALLDGQENNANKIFGSPDDLKLKSCMTLFSSLPDSDPVFQLVLDRFFNGSKDEKTLSLLREKN